MAQVDAILGLGARLYMSPDGITYSELIDLEDIGSPDDPEIEEIECTPLNTPDRAKQYLLGLITYGEFEFTQFYNDARFLLLRGGTKFVSRTMYFRIVLNNAISSTGSTLDIVTLIRKVKQSKVEKTKPVMIEVKARITGASVFTAAK